jgi:hypothetical protein
MILDALLQQMYEAPLARLIRENELAFPWIETAHVLAIVTVVGSISIIDLRLLGWASRERSVSRLTREVLPVTWTAFVLAAASGFLLFISNAPTYSHNAYFRAKLVLLVLAGLNMLSFHAFTFRGVQRWDTSATPRAARIAGACSLTLWALVVVAGRWIGFTMLAGF